MLDKIELVLVGANDAPSYWWDHSGWWMFWLSLILLITVTAVAQIRSAKGGSSAAEIPARVALDNRYARCEIDLVEYVERKQDFS